MKNMPIILVTFFAAGFILGRMIKPSNTRKLFVGPDGEMYSIKTEPSSYQIRN